MGSVMGDRPAPAASAKRSMRPSPAHFDSPENSLPSSTRHQSHRSWASQSSSRRSGGTHVATCEPRLGTVFSTVIGPRERATLRRSNRGPSMRSSRTRSSINSTLRISAMTKPWWHVVPTQAAATPPPPEPRCALAMLAPGAQGDAGDEGLEGDDLEVPLKTDISSFNSGRGCGDNDDAVALVGLAADAPGARYLAAMWRLSSGREAPNKGLATELPCSRASLALTSLLPPLEMKADTSSGFQESSLKDFTREMWAPKERCTPAQSMQIMVP
mmetsp:Transcript_58521/g.128455  ORF Transcript_58521/g.128455 Transcript_58521/m.128455 type:complete len:272 (-) Transcript_58521:496-1311(-)